MEKKNTFTVVERDFAQAMVRYFVISSFIVCYKKNSIFKFSAFCLREELLAWVNISGSFMFGKTLKQNSGSHTNLIIDKTRILRSLF